MIIIDYRIYITFCQQFFRRSNVAPWGVLKNSDRASVAVRPRYDPLSSPNNRPSQAIIKFLFDLFILFIFIFLFIS